MPIFFCKTLFLLSWFIAEQNWSSFFPQKEVSHCLTEDYKLEIWSGKMERKWARIHLPCTTEKQLFQVKAKDKLPHPNPPLLLPSPHPPFISVIYTFGHSIQLSSVCLSPSVWFPIQPSNLWLQWKSAFALILSSLNLHSLRLIMAQTGHIRWK